MMITGKAKIVRAFAAAAAALLLFLLPREGKGADGSPLRAASAFLDLIPDITRGLDLVPSERHGDAIVPGQTLTVWNGSEAVTMDLEEYIIGVTKDSGSVYAIKNVTGTSTGNTGSHIL